LEAIADIIASTTTKNGLKILCELDKKIYNKGIKVSDPEMSQLNIITSDFYPKWNYTIAPRG
jgi:hypothetical protein